MLNYCLYFFNTNKNIIILSRKMELFFIITFFFFVKKPSYDFTEENESIPQNGSSIVFILTVDVITYRYE